MESVNSIYSPWGGKQKTKQKQNLVKVSGLPESQEKISWDFIILKGSNAP